MKTYYRCVLSVGLILPGSTFAVTLGDMTVESYLNQPLKASIALSHLNGLPLSGLKVKLASPEAFKRAGIPRPYSLSKISFRLGNKKGKPSIFISSQERVEEPYLQLLIDVTWAKGQSYRGYTLLLDPPNYSFNTKYNDKPRVYRVKAKPIALPYTNKSLPAIDKTTLSKPSLEKYGPIKAHDDLWQIAKRYKKGNVTLQQIMLGIIAYNPSAFSQGNVNGLKKGVSLTIPPLSEVKLIPADKAKLEVLAQIEAWRDKKTVQHVIKPPYLVKGNVPQTKSKSSFLPPLNLDKLTEKLPEIEEKEGPKKLLQPPSDGVADKSNSASPQAVTMTNKMRKVSLVAPKSALFDDDLIQVPTLLTQMVKSSGEEKKVEVVVDVKNENIKQSKTDKPKKLAPNSKEKDTLANKEIAVAISAIASVKESNQLLRDQIKALMKQNELLKVQSLSTEKELGHLKVELKRLTTLVNQAQAAQNTAHEDDTGFYDIALTIFAFILFVVAGGAVLLYLNQTGVIEVALLKRFLGQENADDETMDDKERQESDEEEKPLEAVELPKSAEEFKHSEQDFNSYEPFEEDAESHNSEVDVEKKHDDFSMDEPQSVEVPETTIDNDIEPYSVEDDIDSPEQEPQDLGALDFEEGLSPTLQELKGDQDQEAAPALVPDAEKTEGESNRLSLEDPVDEDAKPEDKADNSDTKQAVSVATQLALAETYISMDDKESAIEALQEVIAHGDEEAKAKAKELLDTLK